MYMCYKIFYKRVLDNFYFFQNGGNFVFSICPLCWFCHTQVGIQYKNKVHQYFIFVYCQSEMKSEDPFTIINTFLKKNLIQTPWMATMWNCYAKKNNILTVLWMVNRKTKILQPCHLRSLYGRKSITSKFWWTRIWWCLSFKCHDFVCLTTNCVLISACLL